MAGRGRGLGRGRGKPKLNDTPLLSEENKQKLIKGIINRKILKLFIYT